MEMDTKSHRAKAKLNTGHMEDHFKVPRIHGHGAAENATKSENMSKPSRPAFAPFSIKAKYLIIDDVTKRKRYIINEFLINDRNTKFKAMGTWKITKHITKDERT